MSLKTIKFKNIFVSSTGGLLEMYDFSIYAFFASILAGLFFPTSAGKFVGLLSVFAIFATGYLARPLGAAIFGHFGDRFGRKSMLIWTIVLMGLATVLIGVLPTWNQIGVLAPILLLLLRIMQGLAVGGDLAGGITFVAEHAKKESRGTDCSWIFLGVNFGLLLSMAATAGVSALLSHSQLLSWGWRLTFFSGAIIAVIAFYLRFRIREPNIFSEKLTKDQLLKKPLGFLFKYHKANMLQAILLMTLSSVVVGHFIYLPTYFHTVLRFSFQESMLINVLLMLLFSLMVPLAGYLSDRLGRRCLMFFSTLGFLFLAYPIYYAFQFGFGLLFIISLFLLAAFSAGCIGVFPSMLAELFPTEIRYSGLALGYNTSFALFCGTTPIIMTSLLSALGNPLVPSFYLMFGASISLAMNLFIGESRALDLQECGVQ